MHLSRLILLTTILFLVNASQSFLELEKRVKLEAIDSVNKWSKILFPVFKNISSECSSALKKYFDDLKALRLNASSMWDASGKLPSGFLMGTWTDHGDIDECMKVKNSQYCLMSVSMDHPQEVNIKSSNMTTEVFRSILKYTSLEFFNLTIGLCVPSDCSVLDLSELARESIRNGALGEFNVEVDRCQKSVQMFDIPAPTISSWIAWGFLVIFLLFNILGTFFSQAGYLKYFDTVQNYERLVTLNSKAYEQEFLYGLKVITMLFIITGHVLLIHFWSAKQSFIMMDLMRSYIGQLFLMLVPYCPDVFFAITGYEISFAFIKSKGEFDWKNFFFSRWLRFIAVIGATICLHLAIFNETLRPFFAGPFVFADFESAFTRIKSCPKTWTQHLLQIAHLIGSSQCLTEDYFLEVVFVFEIVFVIVLSPFFINNSPQKVLKSCLILILISQIVLVYCLQIYSVDFSWLTFTGMDGKFWNYTEEIHMTPWFHSASFFGGVIVAVVTHRSEPLKISKKITKRIWLSIIIQFYVELVHGPNILQSNIFYTNATQHFYIIFKSLTNAFIFCWVLYNFLTRDISQRISKFLSASVFKILSRLNLSMMFANFLVVCFINASTRLVSGAYLSTMILVRIIPALLYCYLGAFLMHIMIEAPISLIIRELSGKLFSNVKSTKKS